MGDGCRSATDWVSVGNYYPFGDAKSGTVSNADSFATYFRDSTALDYAQQRYYQSGSGRFLTPDPYQASAHSVTPESWNRYPYGGNDPANNNDPSGLFLPKPSEHDDPPFCVNNPLYPGCSFEIFGPGPASNVRPLSMTEIDTILRNDANLVGPNLTACQAFVNALAEIVNTDPRINTALTAINMLFPLETQLTPSLGGLGITVGNLGGTATPINFTPKSPAGRNYSGFRPEYQEIGPNGELRDQVHHVAFFFNLGYILTMSGQSNVNGLVQLAANAVEFNNGVSNSADVQLGMYGGWAGALVGQIANGQLGGADSSWIPGIMSSMCVY